MNVSSRTLVRSGLAFAVAALVFDARAAAEAPVAPAFATVGDTVIGVDEYQAALAAAVRRRYYHARVPPQDIAALESEVGEKLVERTLLVQEAKARGLRPERTLVERRVSEFVLRHGTDERAGMSARLTRQLEDEALLEQLEGQVRAVPVPAETQTRAFYDSHPERFTEPARAKLSLILLRVEPSAPKDAWVGAEEEAQRIHARLRRGAGFAELARLHSADASAARGGDLGYLHRGMLAGPLETQVFETLQPGEVGTPLRVLEGIVIVRLDERRPERPLGFEQARARAADLARRELADQAWRALVADLRRRTPVRFAVAPRPQARAQ